MSIEDRLRERLEKAERLFFGAATTGERDAAEAAIERLKAKLAESARQDPPVEMKFSMPDAWSEKLFVALCRRYGLQAYRYARQRRTTVMVRTPRVFYTAALFSRGRRSGSSVWSACSSKKPQHGGTDNSGGGHIIRIGHGQQAAVRIFGQDYLRADGLFLGHSHCRRSIRPRQTF